MSFKFSLFRWEFFKVTRTSLLTRIGTLLERKAFHRSHCKLIILSHISTANLRRHLDTDQLRLYFKVRVCDDIDLAGRMNNIYSLWIVRPEEVLLIVGWLEKRMVNYVNEVRVSIGNVSIRNVTAWLCLYLEGHFCFIRVDSNILLIKLD